jgi:hypothetical protein
MSGYKADNLTRSTLPDNLADLVQLKTLSLNYYSYDSLPSSNKFTGRLPVRMGRMSKLLRLFVNVQTLSGPLPQFYEATNLKECDVGHGDYCREWSIPTGVNSPCDFDRVPMCNLDCMILYEWIEMSPGNCCSTPGILCNQKGRMIEM